MTDLEVVKFANRLSVFAETTRDEAFSRYHCYDETGGSLKGAQKKNFKRLMKIVKLADSAHRALTALFVEL